MVTAQKRRLGLIRKKKPQVGWIGIVIALLVVVMVFILLAFSDRFWDGRSKLILAVATKNGDVIVSSFDPKTESIVNIFIPGSTQLIASRQLGSWKAKSLWQLGENEKLGGTLLRETIVKNFYFPVVSWGEETALAYSRGDFAGILKAVVTPFETNLKIGDKIKLAFFSLSIKNPKRVDFDLRDGGNLKKTKLPGGEEGYLISGSGMEKFIVYFTDNEISNQNLRVEIRDATGKTKIAQEVGKVIEVLGAKVSAVNKMTEEDTDCEVFGRHRKLVNLISLVYSCSTSKKERAANFDAVVKIGKTFAGRY